MAGPSIGSSDTIVFDNVSKFYGEVLGINRVTLTFEPGITGLVGPNGSGKSTLMNLIGCLDTATAGTYLLEGQDVAGMNEQDIHLVQPGWSTRRICVWSATRPSNRGDIFLGRQRRPCGES